jgi:hypothetical protein
MAGVGQTGKVQQRGPGAELTLLKWKVKPPLPRKQIATSPRSLIVAVD